MAISIAPMHPEDWPAIDEIYRQGIATANATFETESPGWEKWNAAHHPHSRLVTRDREQVLGWAAVSPVSTRRAYLELRRSRVMSQPSARSERAKESDDLTGSGEMCSCSSVAAGRGELTLRCHPGPRPRRRHRRPGSMTGLRPSPSRESSKSPRAENPS